MIIFNKKNIYFTTLCLFQKLKTLRKKKILIGIPAYNEEKFIKKTINDIFSFINKIKKYSFDILVVDDGSSDNTTKILSEFYKKNNNFSYITFIKNFGKDSAILSIINNSLEYDSLIILDGDGQHPPKLIPEFIREWEEGNYLVTGYRKKNNYNLLRLILTKCFYFFFKILTKSNMEENSTDFKLIDKELLLKISKISSKSISIKPLLSWFSKSQKKIYFDPVNIDKKSNFNFLKLVNYAVGNIVSFSAQPLYLIGYIGVTITFISIIILIYSLITYVFFSNIFKISSILIVINTLLFGILLFSVGIIGFYLAQVNRETLELPRYIIDQEYINKNRK